MQDNSNQQQCLEEDEIDLRDLFKIVWNSKKFIILFTLIVTFGAIIFAYTKTPIYEVKSNLQIGYIGDDLLVEPKILEKTLNIVFNVEHKNNKNEKFISEVNNISLVKSLNNFIQIRTHAISNDEALKKNKEVVKYIENAYSKKIDRFIETTNLEIKKIKKLMYQLNQLEKEQLKQQINKLKTQTILNIEKEINKLKMQDIKNLKDKIAILTNQTLVSLKSELSFLKNNMLSSINKKIKLHEKNLEKYNFAVNKLYANKDLDNPVILIQMVNYQNLILNSQNNIENLIIESRKIVTKDIPAIEDRYNNIIEYEIPKLKNQIKNTIEFKIATLEKNKINITNEQLKKLEYQLNIELKNKEENYLNKIEELKYKISSSNIMNSKVIGQYELNNYPIKPKKKLIVVVAFVTSFILSIFLVFFLQFIRSFKEEKNKSA